MIISPEFFAVSGVLNGAIALIYGSYVYIHNRHDRVVTWFFLMTVSLAVWGFSYWQWLLADDAATAILWIRVLSVGSFYIPVLYLHWVVSFLKDTNKTPLLLLGVAHAFALSSSLLVMTPIVISGMGPQLNFSYWPTAGPLYTITIAYLYLVIPIYASLMVIRDRNASSDDKRRIVLNFLLLGTVIGFGSGLTNFPLWYGVQLPPYGTFLNVLFPLLIGYGSVRHGFFNAKVIGAELLVTFILAVLVVQTLLSDTSIELILRIAFLLVVGTLSYLLIRSIHLEVENREKGEKLARYLANANARLRQLDRQKTEFVSVASHQLRSPIAAIKGYTSLILEGSFGEVPKGFDEPLTRVMESSKRIALMVDDFLNVTRIEQGRLTYNMRPHDIHTILCSVHDELRVIAEKKGLAFKLKCDNAADPVMVTADEEKLKQVFSNLVDNAIKYTEKGFVGITLEVMDAHNVVLVKVSDSGIGIAPEEQGELFQKFNRATNANESSVYGTGLGLYIAKEIVKAHGGWVHVSSEGVNKGSTFTVELPLTSVEKATNKEEGKKNKQSSPTKS